MLDLVRYTKYFLFFYLLTLWVSYLINGNNEFINLTTILLTSLLTIFLLFLLQRSIGNPLLLIFIIFTLLFYNSRIIYWLYNPFSIRFALTPGISEINISITTFYILLCTIFVGLGLISAKYSDRRINVNKKKYKTPINIYFLTSLIICLALLNLYLFLVLGSGRNISGFRLPYPEWISRFQKLEIYILMLLVMVFGTRANITKIKKYFIIIALILTIVSFGISSRAAIFNIMIWTFITWLVMGTNLKIKKKYLFGFFFAGILMVINFMWATAVRDFLFYSGVKETIGTIGITDLMYMVEDKKLVLTQLFDQVFTRISHFDQNVMILDIGRVDFLKYINISTLSGSIIDHLFPGTLFQTPALMTQYWHVVTGAWAPGEVYDNYSSMAFSNYGEFYIYFGWGAPIFLFLCSYYFRKVYLKCENMDSKFSWLYCVIVCIVFNDWMQSFLIDTIIFKWYSMGLTILIVYILSRVFETIVSPHFSNIPNSQKLINISN